ncbi:MAG: TrmH family RNA methyltransferase [bacterium]
MKTDNFLFSKILIEEFLNSPNYKKAQKLYINQKNLNLPHVRKIIKLAKEKEIPTLVTNFSKFSNVLKGNSTPLILEISNFSYSSLEDIEKNKSSLDLILFVYKAKDPRNLGAIIRTSKAFDIKGIILTSKDSCPVNDTVINTSRNSLLPIHRINNSLKIIQYLKNKNYKTILLDPRGEITLYSLKKTEKTLLILGGEKGVSEEIKKHSQTARIPIKNIESLNTSVALGITLSYLYNLKYRGE